MPNSQPLFFSADLQSERMDVQCNDRDRSGVRDSALATYRAKLVCPLLGRSGII